MFRFAQHDRRFTGLECDGFEQRKRMPKLCGYNMKRLFRIFELSKNEQRVVLIVIFALTCDCLRRI